MATEDCAGGKEVIDNLEVYIHDSYVRETLDTALFRGGMTRQWAHQTYAEFLAAWYACHILSLPQIISLIFHHDSNGELIPQLHETAAWIANFEPEIFNAILQSNPGVLLRSDVATGDDSSREKLVKALLEWRDKNPHEIFEWRQLPSLRCSKLASILESCIQDKGRNPETRELAVDIAIACNEQALHDLFVEIALNPNEPLHLRITATEGVVKTGEAEVKYKLKPLAMLSLDNRDFGELKYYGILATWPNMLSAKELFTTLEVSTEGKLLDHYIIQNWANLILPELNLDDLPIALWWVQQQQPFHQLPTSFAELSDAILALSWEYLDKPDVANTFAYTSIALWQRQDEVIARQRQGRNFNVNIGLTEEKIRKDNDTRHLLLQHFIQIAPNYKNITTYLWHDVPLVTSDDLVWLTDYYNRTESTQQKTFILELLPFTLNLDDPEQFSYLYEFGQKIPNFWQTIKHPLYVELESEEAKKTKKFYLQRLESERKRKEYKIKQQEERPLISPSPTDHVLTYLNDFENGDTDAWWQMSWWMGANPLGQFKHEQEFEYDFGQLPVWSALESAQQARIINSALQYIQDYKPDSGKCNYSWWEKRTRKFYPIIAGCRAFFLIIDHNQHDLLTRENWSKWAPALTYYIYRSLLYSNEEHKRRRMYALLNLIQIVAPDELIETILWIAECENREEHFFLPSRIDELWNDRLEDAFLQIIHRQELKPENEVEILRSISQYKFSLVNSLLEDWLLLSTSSVTQERERAIFAAQLLLEFAEDACWSLIWPIIQEDKEFGKEIVRRVATVDSRMGGISGSLLVSKLDEASMAEFYTWVYRNYAPQDYPILEGWRTWEHEIADFRDAIPRRLAERGTKESVSELERIQQLLGIDMSYQIHLAKRNYLQNTWETLLPSQFRELIQDKRTRWIQSGSQLLDAIIETLNELNLELQGRTGATPAAIDLWNETKIANNDGKREIIQTPFDENRLSDYVERFLKRKLRGRGVFISRENQIRRGSFTDIYVETSPLMPDGSLGQTITVVIEVKGCWHPDLKTAMQAQLQNRYLAENNIYNGIYLVGRFKCDSWNRNGDQSRWERSNRIDDIELQTFLKNQAEVLSAGGYDIRPFILNASLST